MAGHSKSSILQGRKVIEVYRQAHTELHSKPWDSKVPMLHSILEKRLAERLMKLGFPTLEEFFGASEELKLAVFGECFRIEGKCNHKYHGKVGGCIEVWYLARVNLTANEALEPILVPKEALDAFDFWNESTSYCPPRCSYRIVKVKEPPAGWRWG